MILATGTVVDRYEILGELGRGGMASVYTVRHTKLGSTHVLKVLSVQARAVAERLLLEGQVQATLKHPNVVEVTDVVEVHGSPGLVMEYVEGPSLDAVLANGALPMDRILDLVPGICAGIAAAHSAGVVHRDLKPANILLALHRGRVIPKVADFGLVKQLEAAPSEARTRTGTAMGTPQYMAPEQIENAKEVDARADIWALGAILYEMVTGERAFDGDTHYRIFQAVVAREFRPVRELVPDVPDAVVHTIEAAMAPVDDRPTSVEQLWALWQPGRALDDTPSSGVWPEHTLSGLAALTPSVVPTAGDAPRESQETFQDFDPPADPTPLPVVAEPTAPPTAPRSAVPWVAGVVVVLVLASTLLAAGVAGVWMLRPLPGPTSTPDPAPPDRAPTEPAPAVAVDPTPLAVPTPPAIPRPPPEPAPEPVAPRPQATPDPAPPRPAPAPTPPPPAPEPPPAPNPTPPPATGTVVIAGDLTVTLVGAQGRFRNGGQVPAGVYQVHLTDGDRQETWKDVTVVAGETMKITCNTLWNCN
jgi:serine/threonine-protein kinase